MKPREWTLIVSKVDAFSFLAQRPQTPTPPNHEKVIVREVNPAYDAAVALLYEACERQMASDLMCAMPFNEDMGAALEAYERAMK